MNDKLPDFTIFEEINKNLITNQRLVTKLEALENKITDLSVLRWSWSVRMFWMVFIMLFLVLCAGGVYFAIQQAVKPAIIKTEIESINVKNEVTCQNAGGQWNLKEFIDLIKTKYDTENHNYCIIYIQK